MKIKRNFHVYASAMMLFLLAFPGISMSGAKTDFSGKWTFNETKSNLGEGRYMRSTQLVVKQEGNSISIERSYTTRNGEERTNEQTLSLDGKETTNEGERRSSTSSATWSDDGKSLIMKSHMKFTRQDQTMEVNTVETWTLDKTGKLLTIESKSSSSRGEREATLVYDLK